VYLVAVRIGNQFSFDTKWGTYEGPRPIQVLVCTLDDIPYLPVLLGDTFLHALGHKVEHSKPAEDGVRNVGIRPTQKTKSGLIEYFDQPANLAKARTQTAFNQCAYFMLIL
jgi:hypothetical protein